MIELASLIVALGKAIPFVSRLLTEVERIRVAQTHNAIDKAIAEARKGPSVCPSHSCPLRVLHNGAGGQVPEAPRV